MRSLMRLAIVIMVFSPGSLRAQVNVTVDAGGSSIGYPGASRIQGASFAPSLWWDGSSSYAWLSGSFAGYDDQSWIGGATLGGSLFTSARRPWRAEFGATAAYRAYSADVRTGEAFGFGRLHRAWGNVGAWAGAGYGASRAWDSTRQVAVGDAGAWVRQGAFTLVATAAPRWFGDTSFTDLTVSGRFAKGRVQLDALAGFRPGPAGTQTWQSASALVRLLNPLYLLVAAGEFPDDPIQGLYGGNYVTVGFRVAPRRSPPILPAATLRSDRLEVAPAGVIRAFSLKRLQGDEYRVIVTVAEGAQVEIAGDITDWVPQAMTSTGPGRWEITLPFAPGTHWVNLRVDRGVWTAPPGLPAQSDDFDGTVGVVTVGAVKSE